MKWFTAWVTFSCVVVPVWSWFRALLREARCALRASLEGAAEAHDLDLGSDLPGYQRRPVLRVASIKPCGPDTTVRTSRGGGGSPGLLRTNCQTVTDVHVRNADRLPRGVGKDTFYESDLL
jgi:hypothetical protein